ncbi:hypothetical protein M0R45_008948 [Rubus argutus]|uniref:Uncharacterized protein n=1 Tax=Rubus argutus TaxID=59490 RepID=A0AAW1Y3J9_RUBAR
MINNNEIEVETPSRKTATANVVEEMITPMVSLPEGAVSVAFEVDNEVTISASISRYASFQKSEYSDSI